jgi:hypothetical protein
LNFAYGRSSTLSAASLIDRRTNWEHIRGAQFGSDNLNGEVKKELECWIRVNPFMLTQEIGKTASCCHFLHIGYLRASPRQRRIGEHEEKVRSST